MNISNWNDVDWLSPVPTMQPTPNPSWINPSVSCRPWSTWRLKAGGWPPPSASSSCSKWSFRPSGSTNHRPWSFRTWIPVYWSSCRAAYRPMWSTYPSCSTSSSRTLHIYRRFWGASWTWIRSRTSSRCSATCPSSTFPSRCCGRINLRSLVEMPTTKTSNGSLFPPERSVCWTWRSPVRWIPAAHRLPPAPERDRKILRPSRISTETLPIAITTTLKAVPTLPGFPSPKTKDGSSRWVPSTAMNWWPSNGWPCRRLLLPRAVHNSSPSSHPTRRVVAF